MVEIINFRRAKKAKARAEKEEQAGANRTKFGTPKALRKLTEARSDKQRRDLEGHKKDE